LKRINKLLLFVVLLLVVVLVGLTASVHLYLTADRIKAIITPLV